MIKITHLDSVRVEKGSYIFLFLTIILEVPNTLFAYVLDHNYYLQQFTTMFVPNATSRVLVVFMTKQEKNRIKKGTESIVEYYPSSPDFSVPRC